jgi:hypothetical protein
MVVLLNSQVRRHPQCGTQTVRKEPVRQRASAPPPACHLSSVPVQGANGPKMVPPACRRGDGRAFSHDVDGRKRTVRTYAVASHSTSLAPYLASTLAHSSSAVQRLPPTLTPLTLVGGPPTTLATRSSTFARFSGACVV